jgi:1-acyl-sn-glycerol-3-phosphate acyltransferase
MSTLSVLSWVAIIAFAIYVVRRIKFWLKQGKLMQASGHLPPSPTLLSRLTLGLVARVLVYCCVGRVKVIGRNNTRFEGRLEAAANHSFPLDFFVLRIALGFGCNIRYLTKTAELKGIRGILGAWSGAVPVNTDAQHGGEAAVETSVKLLGQSPKGRLAIFPQGKLVYDNVLHPEDFRTGVVRIVKQVQATHCGEAAAILPIAIFYITEQEDSGWSHSLLRKFRCKLSHNGQQIYGATVVIGDPILACDLSEDPHIATEQLRTDIQRLLIVAEEASASGCCT